MILVTGGTGLIGSHLLYELALQHHRIRALKRPGSNTDNILKVFGYYSDKAAELFNKIEWVNADLTDISSLQSAFEHIETVYHCAGLVSFDRNLKKSLFEVNMSGTANIVNLCIEYGIKKLCFVSSIASFGEYDGITPVDENLRWKPNKKSSYYSISKFKSELEVWRGIAEGLNCVIVNPSVVIGPGFWNNSMGKIFRKVHKGMLFYTLGSTGYVDVRDVAGIMVRLMQSDISGEQFLISSENLTFKEVLDLIAELSGSKKPSIYASPALINIARKMNRIISFFTGTSTAITKDSARIAHKPYICSGKKVKERLNYNFIPVKETFRFTIEKYLSEVKR